MLNKIEQLEEIKNVHSLIKNSYTGCPSTFAKKAGMSKRKLFAILEYLRELGAEIAYDRVVVSYYYQNYFDLEIKARIETKTSKGGQVILSIEYNSDASINSQE